MTFLDVYALTIGIALTFFLCASVCLGALLFWKNVMVPNLRMFSKSTLSVLCVCAFCATMQAQKTKYVDANAAVGGDGSESHPFSDIQEAIDVCSATTNRISIDVMPGIYGPVNLRGCSVNLSVTTNAGERVINGAGGDWAIVGASEEEKSRVYGFNVCNATNGIAGCLVTKCLVADMIDVCVSNCHFSSSRIIGGRVAAVDSQLSSSEIEASEVGMIRSMAISTKIHDCGCGAIESVLTNCTFGGCTDFGAVDSELVSCYVTNNIGCAISNSLVDTCLVAENDIGVLDGVIIGSTIAANRFGGVFGDVVAYNTVLAYNKDGKGKYLNFAGDNICMTNCCTSPLPILGTNNVLCGVPIHPRTYRLCIDSPAIGVACTNLIAFAKDLSGVARIYNGGTDIGAFRYGRVGYVDDCTTGTPIPVPYEWLKVKLQASYNDLKGKGIITDWEDDGYYVRFNYDRYYDGILHKLLYACIYCERMANYMTGKSLPDGTKTCWWQEYLMGTDPNNTNEFFTASISITNGLPKITWKPDLGDERLYLIMGKPEMNDEWELVDDIKNTDCKFFRVGVEMP